MCSILPGLWPWYHTSLQDLALWDCMQLHRNILCARHQKCSPPQNYCQLLTCPNVAGWLCTLMKMNITKYTLLNGSAQMKLSGLQVQPHFSWASTPLIPLNNNPITLYTSLYNFSHITLYTKSHISLNNLSDITFYTTTHAHPPQTIPVIYVWTQKFVRFGQRKLYADFIYVWLYMGCGYPTVDINYANCICAISRINIMLAYYTVCHISLLTLT